jgi:signal transduction histidine kinase
VTAPGRRQVSAAVARLRADAHTVRVRTTAIAVLAVGLALTGAAVALVLLLQNTLNAHAASTARSRAAETAAALSAGARPANLTMSDDEWRFLQLIDGRGRVLASTSNLAGRAAISGPAPGRTVVLRHVLPDAGDFVVATAVARAADGPVTVLSGYSLDEAEDSAQTATGLLLAGVPVLLIVVCLTTWFVVGRALVPVESIRAEVDRISENELHRRLDGGSDDNEIGRLAATMNRMLDRLEQSYRQQRRFVSDASHELRSPVASIRQHAEVALSHPHRTTVPELAGTVLAEDRRIQHLVEDLLLLARADEHGSMATWQPVDLDDLVLDQARRVRAADRVGVDLSGVSAGRVLGDAGLLTRLVGNLVENAARHAHSRIALGLTHDRQARMVVLRVDDDGPGIGDADRERVFERFVRLDEARPRDTGGAGLGLAIAAEVARAHGGSIAVGHAPLGGARLEVCLPALED